MSKFPLFSKYSRKAKGCNLQQKDNLWYVQTYSSLDFTTYFGKLGNKECFMLSMDIDSNTGLIRKELSLLLANKGTKEIIT